MSSRIQFYKTWVNTPLKAQAQVESITRSHIGVPCCPVAGIPLPDEREHRVGDLDWSGEAREASARKGATTATVTTAAGADAKSARVS